MLSTGLATVGILAPEKGGGVVIGIIPDWAPSDISPEIRMAATAAREALREHLAPSDPIYLSARVAKLLAHRWRFQRAEAINPGLQRELMVDWIDDLVEFPLWAIDTAAQEWRRSHEDFPTIAGIRRLSEEAVAGDRRTLRLLDRLLASQTTEGA